MRRLPLAVLLAAGCAANSEGTGSFAGSDAALSDVPPVIVAPTPTDASMVRAAADVSAALPAARDAAVPDAAVPDAVQPDAARAEAASARACGTPRTAAGLTVYPRRGNAADSAVMPRGPGLVLMGGGADVDAAFVWMHDVVAGSRSGDGGDVIVLRATGADGYDAYLQRLAAFSSIRTILIPAAAGPVDLAAAATHVDCAEAVFFAGGDQSDYVRWGSALMAAVQGVWDRGGVVGGTSAGLAILGQLVYDARTGSVTSVQATANPFHPTISFTRDMLRFPPLAAVITDSHFVARDRFGRLVAFLARLGAEGVAGPIGIGVDERAAVVVDRNGLATLLGTGTAYVARTGAGTRAVAGSPLVAPAVTVTRLIPGGPPFDLGRRCGAGPTYTVAVDGARSPSTTPANPYMVAGAPGTCP